MTAEFTSLGSMDTKNDNELAPPPDGCRVAWATSAKIALGMSARFCHDPTPDSNPQPRQPLQAGAPREHPQAPLALQV